MSKWPSWISKLVDREPIRRYEWLAMRLLMVWPLWTSVVFRIPSHWTEGASTAPNGMARWVDLSFASDPAFQSWWIPLMIWCLCLYVLGLVPVFATGMLFLGQILIGTLGNSLGAIHHTSQVMALVLLAQLIAHLVHLARPSSSGTPGRSLLARIARYYVDWAHALIGGWKTLLEAGPRHREPHHDWVRFSQQFLAATYVASGISKLLASGGQWVAHTPRMALQFEKTRWSGYYDYLEHRTSDLGATVSQWVSAYPLGAQIFFGMGLLLELGCILALWRRSTALFWGLGLLSLHTVVSHLMGLGFGYHKWLLLILFINVPYWIWRWILKRRGADSGQLQEQAGRG